MITLKHVPEVDDSKRVEFRQHLGYLVRLRDAENCSGPRTIRWEVGNACVVSDFDQALTLVKRLSEPAMVAYCLGRLHFTFASFPESLEPEPARFDLPLGPTPSWMRQVSTVAVGYRVSRPSMTAATRGAINHLRDAIKYLEDAIGESVVLPSARLMLAASYAAINDGHNAAIQYQRMLDNKESFLAACADEVGPLWADLDLEPKIASGVRRCLVEVYQSAGETENAILSAEAWIQADPGELGTYDRLARLYQQKGDFQAAYDCLRKEADRSPTFGEDPNVSIALAIGDVLRNDNIQELIAYLAAFRPEQHAMVEAIVNDYWPQFDQLAGDSRREWVAGVFLLTTNIPLGPGHAGRCFSVVLEQELRARIFERYREYAPNDRVIPANEKLTLGAMVRILEQARRPNDYPKVKGFAEWISRENPDLLDQVGEVHAANEIRKPAVHKHSHTTTAEDASLLSTECRKLLNTLLIKSG